MIENLTDVELEAYIELNPTALDTIFKPVLTKREYAFMSKAERDTYESDLNQQSISKIAPQIEKDVKDATGIDKNAGETYSAYNQRVLKALADEKKQLAAEVNAFKGKSDLTKVERENYEALQQEAKLNASKIKELTDNSAKELNKARTENEVVRQMGTVTGKLIKSDIPGVTKAQEIMSERIFADIQDMAQKDSRGQIILIDKNGQPVLNADKTFKTVSQYTEDKMSEAGFVETGKSGKGAGGTPLGSDITKVPGGVKTQVELMDYLRDGPMKGKSQSELLKEFDKYAPLLTR